MASPTAFDEALRFVLRHEGVVWSDDGEILKTGYVNDPQDPGGETNFGISKAAYPTLDIKNLTIEQATRVYRAIWDHWGCQGLPDGWAWFLFDSAVQHLPVVVERLRLHNSLADALWDRVSYYATRPTFARFGRGWILRMDDLRGKLAHLFGMPL